MFVPVGMGLQSAVRLATMHGAKPAGPGDGRGEGGEGGGGGGELGGSVLRRSEDDTGGGEHLSSNTLACAGTAQGSLSGVRRTRPWLEDWVMEQEGREQMLRHRAQADSIKMPRAPRAHWPRCAVHGGYLENGECSQCIETTVCPHQRLVRWCLRCCSQRPANCQHNRPSASCAECATTHPQTRVTNSYTAPLSVETCPPTTGEGWGGEKQSGGAGQGGDKIGSGEEGQRGGLGECGGDVEATWVQNKHADAELSVCASDDFWRR
jgi:hypothetical protein